MSVPAKQPSANGSAASASKPKLLFFYSATSGSSRRAEGFLAQVLQRRQNHETFAVHRIDEAQRPDLAERFGVTETPALLVIDGQEIRARLEQPRGCVEIQTLLAPWLR
jgi:thioredoxin-like negative regulator of GroEL